MNRCRRNPLFLLPSLLLLVNACSPDQAADRDIAAPSGPATSGSSTPAEEEEVFGKLVVADQTAWSAFLNARDPATAANQPAYRSSNVPVNFLPPGQGGHQNSGAEWGWYGLGFNDQCSTTNLVTEDENFPEAHRPPGDPLPTGGEVHCATAGRFTLELWQHDVTLALSRPVDFFGYDTHVFRGGDPLSPLGVVEKENQFTSPGFATNDVIVDYDATTGSSASPMVEISAVESRADAVWNPIALQAGAYRAPSNFWLRFSASQSVPASGYIPEQLLVRYFWHWGVDVADRTNFANTIGEQDALIRVHQFSAGTHTVRVHVVQPREKPTDPADETSTNYGSVLDLSFNIYSPLTSAITVNSPQPVELGQAASFTAGGGNGAGGNEYRWEFGAGEGVIDWSSNANSSYTFQSTGSKTVTLRKRDSYGYLAVGTTTVNVVQSPPLTASIHGFYANQNGAVRRTQDCEWRADAAGGSGTYTYQWYQDDVLLPGETGRFLWLNTGTASFTVKVVVQSAGQSANGIKSVSVTTNGQICA